MFQWDIVLKRIKRFTPKVGLHSAGFIKNNTLIDLKTFQFDYLIGVIQNIIADNDFIYFIIIIVIIHKFGIFAALPVSAVKSIVAQPAAGKIGEPSARHTC